MREGERPVKRVSNFFTVRVPRAVLVAVVVVLVGATAYAWEEGVPPFGPGADTWHGVFLSNGQAYFGHFHSPPGEYATLREVYYVLATQLQTQDPQQAAQGPQLTLQRLGSEIHGPKQEMRIPKTAILFVEELRPDSKLLDAIKLQKGGR